MYRCTTYQCTGVLHFGVAKRNTVQVAAEALTPPSRSWPVHLHLPTCACYSLLPDHTLLPAAATPYCYSLLATSRACYSLLAASRLKGMLQPACRLKGLLQPACHSKADTAA